MKLKLCSLLLCLLLILCACAPVQTGETDAALTDKELIYKIADSGAIQSMHFSSYMHGSVAEAMSYYSEDFAELWSRESGVESLRLYGPEIAEEYLVFHSNKTRNKGWDLLWLLGDLFPDVEMDKVIADLRAQYDR